MIYLAALFLPLFVAGFVFYAFLAIADFLTGAVELYTNATNKH